MQVVLVYLHSPAISSQFTLKVCAAAEKLKKKSLKLSILKVQSILRSSMLIPIESPSAVLLMASLKSMSI